MDIEELFTDEKSENEGVWVDAGLYDPTMKGLELKIARLMNPSFTRLLDEQRRDAGPKYDEDEQLQITVMIHVYARTILKGWKGLTAGGEPVKFSVAKAEDYLARSTDFRNVVTRISQDRQRFKAKQEEADLKN